MNFDFYKSCLTFVGAGAIALNASFAASATENFKPVKELVKPIKVNVNQTVYLSKNLDNANGRVRQREYIYKAPDNKVISNPQQLTKNQGYKVEVHGSTDELLKQVKSIEPKAFRKGDIIQVGIFSEQGNAEILVRKLAVAGFWARIVSQ